MINITISPEVPEYFKGVHKATIEKEHKIQSIHDYIYHKCPTNAFYEKYKSIIDNMLTLKVMKGIEHLPLQYTIYNGEFLIPMNEFSYVFIPPKGEYHETIGTFSSLPAFRQVVSKIEGTTDFVDLLDGYCYSNEGRKDSELMQLDIIKPVIKEFDLQPLIDWYDNGRIFREYMNLVNSAESQIALKLYDMWISHNIQLLNK